MKYRRVGNSGLKISEITYGSWLTFGNQVELDQAQEIIEKAFELGINSFDTADVYRAGEAERLLGKILPHKNRNHFVIATKAFFPMSDHISDRGLSRKHLFDSVAASSDRLNLKTIDLMYCHRYDDETPLTETCEAFNDLIRLGKIHYWGTSEWSAEQITEAHKICLQKNWPTPIVNQPYYNLLGRTIEKEIAPTCQKLGMGIASFSPLAQGVLSGKYSGGSIPKGSRGGDESMNMWMKDHLNNSDLLNRIDQMKDLAQKYELSISQLALAWVLQNSTITSVISGASSPAQLVENSKASGVVLTPQDKAFLDQLFPIN
jgi:voltage-dependent potassium channel beta subunit